MKYFVFCSVTDRRGYAPSQNACLSCIFLVNRRKYISAKFNRSPWHSQKNFLFISLVCLTLVGCSKSTKSTDLYSLITMADTISLDEYENWKTEAEFTNLVSLDDYLEQGSEGRIETFGATFQQPEAAVQKQELKKMLVEALKTLTEKEQSVITFYYYEELTLKEISQILSVSESRVSQLHTKALKKIKNQLGDSIDLLNLF